MTKHAADLSPAASAPVSVSGATLLVGCRFVAAARRNRPHPAPRCRSPAQPGLSGAFDVGTAGGYQLGAGANLPPLLLDDDEAVAVALGLRTSASGSVTGIEEASVRALMKLEQVLPPRLRHRVAALHRSSCRWPSQARRSTPIRLSTIAGACRDHEGIRFQLQRSQPVHQARAVVEPHRLVHTGYRWYLVAWDLSAQRLANVSRRPHRGQAEDLGALQTAQAAGGRFCGLRVEVSVTA